MKVKREFLWLITDVKISRTYGGSDYTVRVFENKGRGKVVLVGENRCCTRAHRGEVHEAFGVVMNQDQKLHKEVALAGLNEHYYWCHEHGEQLGIWMTQLGG